MCARGLVQSNLQQKHENTPKQSKESLVAQTMVAYAGCFAYYINISMWCIIQPCNVINHFIFTFLFIYY